MATYAIGDIQGCYTALQQLLKACNFDPHQDDLWLAGDLVNRGANSLEVLRYLSDLPRPPRIVLGNHDLHFLAVALNVRQSRSQDTLDELLKAKDKIFLVEWLLQQPLLHFEPTLNCVMTHAGIAPCWDLPTAQAIANEVSHNLQATPELVLSDLFGNTPDNWSNDYSGSERFRSAINYLTRMRYCYSDGRLNFSYKGSLAAKPAELYPWYLVPHRKLINSTILFGHWAALNGNTDQDNVIALDTGCAWGNCLTALKLEDRQYFQVSCN